MEDMVQREIRELIGVVVVVLIAITVASLMSGCGEKPMPAMTTKRSTVIFTEPAVLSPPCGVCTFTEEEAATYTPSIASR